MSAHLDPPSCSALSHHSHHLHSQLDYFFRSPSLHGRIPRFTFWTQLDINLTCIFHLFNSCLNLCFGGRNKAECQSCTIWAYAAGNITVRISNRLIGQNMSWAMWHFKMWCIHLACPVTAQQIKLGHNSHFYCEQLLHSFNRISIY